MLEDLDHDTNEDKRKEGGGVVVASPKRVGLVPVKVNTKRNDTVRSPGRAAVEQLAMARGMKPRDPEKRNWCSEDNPLIWSGMVDDD